MIVLGVEISGRDLRIVALQEINGVISDITGTYKPISIEDDELAINVKRFRDTLFATLDSFSPNVIVIKYRNPNGKGKMAPSPISFKVEALIQTFEGCDIVFTKPQTTTAYFKKHTLSLRPKYTYQVEALKMAYHYIKTN